MKIPIALEHILPGLLRQVKGLKSYVSKEVKMIRIPDGYNIDIRYNKIDLIKVSKRYREKVWYTSLTLPNNELNPTAIRRAFLVNTIHGLDALHMSSLLRNCWDKGVCVLPIHDCILIEYSNFNSVIDIPANNYMDLYIDDVLYSICSQIESSHARFVSVFNRRPFKSSPVLSISHNCFKVGLRKRYSTSAYRLEERFEIFINGDVHLLWKGYSKENIYIEIIEFWKLAVKTGNTKEFSMMLKQFNSTQHLKRRMIYADPQIFIQLNIPTNIFHK